MTMQEAEQLNQVLIGLRDQYRTAVREREGARPEVLKDARDVMSRAHEDWAAGRLRAAVKGFAEALLILRQV